MKKYYSLVLLAFLISCQGNSQEKKVSKKAYEITKTDTEWRVILSPLAYNVLRHAATEPKFTGPLNDNKQEGTYVCGGCRAPLYESQYKYDSKSGWPSFDRGIEENLEYDVDYKIGYPRSELKCSKCGGHLGHMFNDGPKKTTGQRHCINSVALAFIPKDGK
ncbi:MAG: peptide-methionine (R)-S-oxide reductase [Flavobacteriaceae bacterium]|jgi:peptide-methionine (R)-S-oxide reductase|tara:strand:+ start:435 stop:920 length:486 start_codon:yes stop_codon:yes gene_type:complete